VGTLHNALRTSLGLVKGLSRAVALDQDAGVERFGETLTPVLDIWRQPEWAFLRDESLLLFGTIASAVAGEFSYNGVSNPADSGMLVVVEAVMPDGAGAYNIRFRDTDTPTVATGVIRRDLRWPAAQVSRSQYISGAEAAGSGASMMRFTLPAAGTAQPPWMALGIILPPGTNVVLEHNTVNTAFTANWLWRERRLLPGEL
jgi:hypothetical protein